MMRAALAWICVALVACKGAGGGADEEKRRGDFMKAYVATQDGGAAWDLGLNDELRFGAGFCPTEPRRENGAYIDVFRRMAFHGVVALRSHGRRSMRVRLVGRLLPWPYFKRTTVTLTLQGEVVDSFVIEQGAFDHVSDIESEELTKRAWVDLGISVNNTTDDHFHLECKLSRFLVDDLRWEER
jgi:hypothetical protein